MGSWTAELRAAWRIQPEMMSDKKCIRLPCRPPMIGVVGGVGPRAGVEMVHRLHRESGATSDQTHPRVLLWSAPSDIPDRTAYLLGESQADPAPALADILVELGRAGATVAGIPCVTAHAPAIFDRIQRQVRGRGAPVLLSMIEALQLNLRRARASRIGILSTLGTHSSGLFQESLAEFELQFLDPTGRRRLHQAIYRIKAESSSLPEGAVDTIRRSAAELIHRGAEVVILGCTELPLALPQESLEGVPLLDPMAALSQELIRHYERSGCALNCLVS